MAEGNYQTSRTLLHIKDIIEVCLILHYSQVMTHDDAKMWMYELHRPSDSQLGQCQGSSTRSARVNR